MWSQYEIIYSASNTDLPLASQFKELTDRCRRLIMQDYPTIPPSQYSRYILSNRLTLTSKVLVLDLDQTCVNAFESLDSLRQLMEMSSDDSRAKGLRVKDRIGIINLDNEDSGNAVGLGYRLPLWFVTRPYLPHFLYLCTLYFKHIVVYSAGIGAYVNKVVHHIFDNLQLPKNVFSRTDCAVRRDGNFEKPLSKLRKEYHLDFITSYNTFIVDDTKDVFHQTDPNNGIHIPRYEISARFDQIEDDEDSLFKLAKWLMDDDVIYSTDVRQLDKTNIFS